MKVAIISEDGLPDIRVEKMINTLSKIADEIHFVGRFRGFTGIVLNSQPVIHNIDWNKRANLLIPPYFPKVERKVLDRISMIKPDLIIAVNLVSAYISQKAGVPVILDYHEIFTKMLEEIKVVNPYKKLGLFLRKKVYYKLENMLSSIPFITISNEAANYFRQRYGNKNYIVVKNYPSITEVNTCKLRFLEGCSPKKFLYIGSDFVKYDGRKYRDLRKTTAVFDKISKYRKDFKIIIIGSDKKIRDYVYPMGKIRHIDIYKIINQVHYGLLSYYPNNIQKYFSPNKVYIYAHIAAIPIITDTLKEVIRDLNNHALLVKSSDFEKSLKELLEYTMDMHCDLLNELRLKIYDYARTHLIWEKFDNQIISFVKKNMQKYEV